MFNELDKTKLKHICKDPDLLKVVIEEAIEYWVGAGGGDADEMEEQVEGHHVIRVLEHVHCFGHQTEQAEKCGIRK